MNNSTDSNPDHVSIFITGKNYQDRGKKLY